MKTVTFFIPILLLTGILCLQFLNYCSDQNSKRDGTIDTVFVKSTDHYHTIPFKVEVPVPYRVEVPGTSITFTVPSLIDSLAVVIDYYSKRFYSDSLKNDSIEVKLDYACYKNRITDMKLQYRWIAPTMVLEKSIDRQLIFAGIDVMGPKFGFYPSVYFDTKTGMYGGGYDPINKNFKIGAYFKFKLWKKK